MVLIKSIASSSLGNAYLVVDVDSSLLLECGLPINKLKKALDFKLSKIDGCLISHSHLDHAKSAKALMACGINCYMSGETAKTLKLSGHRLKIIEPLKQFSIGPWSILPFKTEHDCPGSLGYLLQSRDEKVLFLIDTAYCRYQFKGVTNIMIECNYQLDILNRNIEIGAVHASLKDRTILNHFSLENVLDFLKVNDLSKVKGIWLMHLSNSNSNAGEMKKAVQQATGKQTVICGK